jgi:tartrate/fumarate subfamily iron-sulfur-dependent hydro-lyase beta chain
MKTLRLPFSPEAVRALRVGDAVLISGVMVTARDAAHKWMIDTFIRKTRAPTAEDEATYRALKPLLEGGTIYHCGPVVAGLQSAQYVVRAAGPTTSIREEPYQGEVMRHFGLRAVIGKGGMGPRTLQACAEGPAVYLHAIGGAAPLIAESVRRVVGVYKLEFGVPEAMWVIQVESFPAVVTMDAHGKSLHAEVQERSRRALDRLFLA